MRWFWWVVLVLMVLFTVRFAWGLDVSCPNSLVGWVGERINGSCSIRNNHNFTIFNVSFSPLSNFRFSVLDNVSQNSSGNVSFWFRSNTSFGNTSFVSRVSFLYLVNVSPAKVNYSVYFVGGGVVGLGSGGNLSVRVGDGVRFHNNESGVLNLQVGSDYFNVSSGGSLFWVVSSDFCFFSGFLGGCVLINSSPVLGFGHSSSYDLNKSFWVGVNGYPVRLNVSLFTTVFNVSYGGVGTGVLLVRNLGNVSAVGVNLSVSPVGWANFSSNNFVLGVGVDRVVTLSVRVNVSGTNMTNRSHIIILKVCAVNMGFCINKSFSVFVPFYDFMESNVSRRVFEFYELSADEFVDFCEQDGWVHPICVKALRNRTVVEFKDKVTSVDVTEDDYLSAVSSGLLSKDFVDRVSNLFKEPLQVLIGKVDNLSDVTSSLNSSVVGVGLDVEGVTRRVERIERGNTFGTIILWVVIGFVVVVVLVYYFYVYVMNRKLRVMQ